MGRILFIAFLLVPLTEIYVLIQVGGLIGALPTVVLVVFTAVLGAVLIRVQGLATVARMRQSMDRGELPALELLEGACLLAAGALLLTPGFVTDTVGFVLLVPGLRRALIVAIAARGVRPRAPPPGGPGANTPAGPGRVIEGEYRRED
jgi:UPF0716 protein FxsA